MCTNYYFDEMFAKINDPQKYQEIKNQYVAEELYRVIMIEEKNSQNREKILKIFNSMFE